MLRYPARATPALARIYKRFNDISIFVEDTTYVNMYQALFERMLNGRARVRKIFQLNGRTNVINAASSGRYKGYKKRLFIIDGDIDLLLGRPEPAIPDLYRLKHYCAENLFLGEEASVEVAFDSCPDRDRAQIKEVIAFERWRNDVVKTIFPLFVKYAAVHHLNLNIPTSSYGALAMCDGQKPNRKISKSLVAARAAFVEGEILKHIKKADLRAIEKKIRASAERTLASRLRYISGKTYLVPLLALHLQQQVDFTDSPKKLPLRLARFVATDVDSGLKTRIEALI